MVLEATMICVDNSEWTRNGDYNPNRFQAQAIDAVNLICASKAESNPENSVGILKMAGDGGVRVLVTPTNDPAKILACIHGLEVGGEMDLPSGIKVAQLALKHRQNKMQKQRIVLFVGSPLVKYDKKLLENIGQCLKKNSVALDVVSFGEEDEEGKSEKLKAMVAAACVNNTSHFIHLPPSPDDFSDMLIRSPICGGEEGNGDRGDVSGFEFGVDPDADPELALALRLSMEEERARQARQAAAAQ